MTASPPPSVPLDILANSLLEGHDRTLLYTLLEHVSDGVAITDGAGVMIHVNPAARRFAGVDLRGWKAEEEHPQFGVFTADTRRRVVVDELPINRVLLGEDSAVVDLFVVPPHHPAGYYLHMNARAVRDAAGQRIGILLLLRDTTAERQAAAEHRRTEQRYRLIVENALEGVWVLDPDSRTLYVNAFMARMLGYTEEEMLGRHVLDFLPEDIRDISLSQLDERRRGISDVVVVKMLHKQGHLVWTRLSSCRIVDDGQFIGALAMVSDITQSRESEEQIRQLNATLERRIAERTAQLEFSNRELEAFAYSVAHDLRAPLRSISNFTLALTEDCAGQLDATGLDYVQRIRASSQRMSELIDGILSLSRVSRTALREEDVDLSALARSVAEGLQRWQPERRVRFHVQEGLRTRGDGNLLRSVLENLLGNAWKFTRERAEADITFGVRPGTDAGRVYFVRDNGAGFDMEYRAKLFGVFQRLHTQREFEGTGVGLATVQRIIQRHEGRVWAEGQVNQGATFFFTLHAPPTGA